MCISIGALTSCAESSPEKAQKQPQKISSSLSQVLKSLETPEEDTDKKLKPVAPQANIDDEGRVQVYVKLYDFNQENLKLLKAHGLKVDIYDEQQKLVQGWALPENIKIMSQFEFVKMIDLPSYGYTR